MIFILLIALMLTGIPVSIALGLTVLTFLFTLTEVPIEAVSMKLFTGIENFEIMAIPFFILAGNFLTHGGVARRMIAFATSIVGHWHGGLGLAGIVACAMFALVCGSSVATVAAIGAIVLPEMVRNGYPMRFGAGIITVAGSLGILMLPSIPKIIYAISTNTSIGALFVAGLLPGMLLTSMLCAVTWFLARKRDYPRMPRSTWLEAWRAFRESVWGLMLVVIIIGGIYSGLFTATEAAAMAAVYSFFISVFVYKALKIRDVPQVLLGPRIPARCCSTSLPTRCCFHLSSATRIFPRRWPTGSSRKTLAGSASSWWSTCCCWLPAISWSRLPSS